MLGAGKRTTQTDITKLRQKEDHSMVSVRKMIGVGMLSICLGGSIVSADSVEVIDIEQSYAKKEIQALVAKGILSGYEDGAFLPNKSMNRAELASVFVKVLGLSENKAASASFEDVSADAWYAGAVGALVKAGITQGTSATTFSPEKTVSREELTVLFVRAMGLEKKAVSSYIKLPFVDAGQISPWASKYVALAHRIGFIQGSGDGAGELSFDPSGEAQRQALARLAYEFVENKQKLATVAETADEHERVISDIADGQLILDDGAKIKISTALKSALLHSTNRAALKNSTIRYRLNEAFEVGEIMNLDVRQSGTAKSFSVLDGMGTGIAKNLQVSGDYVTIKNLKVAGNLIVAKSVANDFHGSALTVKGTTMVEGGSSNTVVFESSMLNHMDIQKPSVKLELQKVTNLNSARITGADVTFLLVDSGSKVNKLDLQTTSAEIGGKGSVDELNIEKKDAVIALNVESKIGQVTIKSEGTTLKGTAEITKLNIDTTGATKLVLDKKPEIVDKKDGAQIEGLQPAAPMMGGGFGGGPVGGGGAQRDTTAPDVSGATVTIGGVQVSPTSGSNNSFSFTKPDSITDNMKITHFTITASADTATLKMEGSDKVIYFSNGVADVRVSDLLGGLDRQGDGVAISTIKLLKGDTFTINGELTDGSGNSSTVSLVLAL
jgi:hypothetical protein